MGPRGGGKGAFRSDLGHEIVGQHLLFGQAAGRIGDQDFGNQDPWPRAPARRDRQGAIHIGIGERYLGAELRPREFAPGKACADEVAEGFGLHPRLGDDLQELLGCQVGAAGEFLHPGGDLLVAEANARRLGRVKAQPVLDQRLFRLRHHIARRAEDLQEAAALVQLIAGDGAVVDRDHGRETVALRLDGRAE